MRHAGLDSRVTVSYGPPDRFERLGKAIPVGLAAKVE